MADLDPYEIAVLRMMDGSGPELPWGAAMSVALQRLAGIGMATRGPNFQITQAGQDALTSHGDHHG